MKNREPKIVNLRGQKIKGWLNKELVTKDLTKETKMYFDGYNDCKNDVLKILQQDWTGLDMSPNSCDSYYIDKVKEL